MSLEVSTGGRAGRSNLAPAVLKQPLLCYLVTSQFRIAHECVCVCVYCDSNHIQFPFLKKHIILVKTKTILHEEEKCMVHIF